jgi:hypothetical protein
LTTLGLLFLCLFLVRVLREMSKTNREHPDLIGHFIVATIIAACGSLLMSKGVLLIVRVLKEATVPVLDISLSGVLSGTVLFTVGGFFVGISTAATVDHPLPRVQIAAPYTVESKELLAHLERELYLAAHTDGYWHLG